MFHQKSPPPHSPLWFFRFQLVLPAHLFRDQAIYRVPPLRLRLLASILVVSQVPAFRLTTACRSVQSILKLLRRQNARARDKLAGRLPPRGCRNPYTGGWEQNSAGRFRQPALLLRIKNLEFRPDALIWRGAFTEIPSRMLQMTTPIGSHHTFIIECRGVATRVDNALYLQKRGTSRAPVSQSKITPNSGDR